MKGKKTGGRQKGTPNKTSATVRKAIADIINNYYDSETFISDIAALKPKDRVDAMEKLAAYVVPKLQATSIDIAEDSVKTIEDKLIELGGGDDDEE